MINLIRVCNPKAVKVRVSLDLTDSSAVEDMLYGNTDLENIQDILLATFGFPVERINSTRGKNDSEISSPGRKRTSSKSISDLFDLLNKILKMPLETKSSSDSGQKTSSKKNIKQTDRDGDIKNLMKKLYAKFQDFIITFPEYPNRYEIFLVVALRILKKLDSTHERGLECAQIIKQLNEMIRNDESFSKLPNIEKIKIFLLLEILTKLYHQNLEIPYVFDEVEIFCAFKPMIVLKSETYNVDSNFLSDFEKAVSKGRFENKISDQAQFLEDEQKIDTIKAKYTTKFISDSM